MHTYIHTYKHTYIHTLPPCLTNGPCLTNTPLFGSRVCHSLDKGGEGTTRWPKILPDGPWTDKWPLICVFFCNNAWCNTRTLRYWCMQHYLLQLHLAQLAHIVLQVDQGGCSVTCTWIYTRMCPSPCVIWWLHTAAFLLASAFVLHSFGIYCLMDL